MKKSLFLIIPFIIFSSLFSQNIDKYTEINKSFELYGEIYKLLLENYVLELNPEKLTSSSIEGMFSELDPYTNYFTPDEDKYVERMTRGTYTGFGIAISEYDSLLTIEEVSEDNSAFREGIRPGDKIYKIDGTVVLKLSGDSIEKYTNGVPGSQADVWIIRGNDTLKKKLTRETIVEKNVRYSGFVQDSIAYICLGGFTPSATYEVRAALNSLKRQRKLAGIILDLRNNPGGLMYEAVKICEMFVPQGSLITSTKGRNIDKNEEYKTSLPPDNPDMKLAILLNEYSASASECLAGAIQDLDRGIILGERSYGKGLVQEFFRLPNEGKIKITTARYYTPSGRCIQRRNFADSYQKEEDFLEDTNKVTIKVFKTKAGRSVTESHGIEPDSTLDKKEYTDYVNYLYRQRLFFKYVNKNTWKLDSLPKNFSITEEMLEDFKKYVDSCTIKFESKENALLKELKEKAKDSKRGDNTLVEIDKLSTLIEQSYKDEFTKNTDTIKKFLEREYLSRFKKESEIFGKYIKDENWVKSTCQILTGKEYKKLLKVNN